MIALPEWVKHVNKSATAKGPWPTWCGQTVIEFVFQDLDHAAADPEGRLQACPECVDTATAALESVRWDPPY